MKEIIKANKRLVNAIVAIHPNLHMDSPKEEEFYLAIHDLNKKILDKSIELIKFNEVDSQGNMFKEGCFTNIEECKKNLYSLNTDECNILESVREVALKYASEEELNKSIKGITIDPTRLNSGDSEY